MSMTYGHSATESVVSIFEGEARDTGLNLEALEDISAYFREVRRKYAKWEGSLKGIDSRILVAQVPGGMLTNMENQLKEQGAGDKLDDVLKEIPRVRKDLGYIPLVTPTSQIVGTQAVLNVMTGERYKSISKETAGVLKGEYGATAAPVNAELQERVLEGKAPITCRPADLLEPEVDKLTQELKAIAAKENISLAKDAIDDVLTYALFPQIGIKFLKNRGNPEAFEPAPTAEPEVKASSAQSGGQESYDVAVDGKKYHVTVAPSGHLVDVKPISIADNKAPVTNSSKPAAVASNVEAPLAGNIFKVLVSAGDEIEEGQTVIILEAMKMETEVKASLGGTVAKVHVTEGDAVSLGDPLVGLS